MSVRFVRVRNPHNQMVPILGSRRYIKSLYVPPMANNFLVGPDHANGSHFASLTASVRGKVQYLKVVGEEMVPEEKAAKILERTRKDPQKARRGNSGLSSEPPPAERLIQAQEIESVPLIPPKNLKPRSRKRHSDRSEVSTVPAPESSVAD